MSREYGVMSLVTYVSRYFIFYDKKIRNACKAVADFFLSRAYVEHKTHDSLPKTHNG